MNEQDGFRIEAALQFGFAMTNDDATEFKCTEAQLIAFAKACERKGRAEAAVEAERIGEYSTPKEKGALGVLIHRMKNRNAKTDAELAPILEAESER